HAQLEDSNELFQKLLEDLQIINKEMAEYVNSPSRDHPIFFDNDVKHSVQNKEYLENSSNEITASNSNQEKEKPPQDFDIRQLIREECCIEVFAPILSAKEHEYSFSMGYEHPNTTPETELDEIIKSGVEELVQILSENEVTSEDKRKCDMPVCENSPICDDHSEIFSDSNNDDDISSDDNAFEDIEYIEASLPDSEIVSVGEENDVHQEEEEFDLEEIQDVVLREKLLSINRLIANIESLNENPTPDCVLNSSALIPIFEGSDNSLSDNSSPKFETFCDHMEETRSEVDLFLASDNSIPPGIENIGDDSEGDVRFLEGLLIDDSIPFPNNEASDFDNPSFPRPPPKPPDAEFDVETDAGEEISVVMNDKLEGLDPRDEIDNEEDDYFLSCLSSKFFYHILSIPRFFLFFSPLIVRTPSLTLDLPLID
nr:hypothetical protein [Tanacetum cinerariifolium]